MDIGSEGLMPAETGVAGRVTSFGDLGSGKGSEAELSLASKATFSRCDGRLGGSAGDRGVDPEDAGLEPWVVRGPLLEVSTPFCGPGALATLLLSLPRLDFVLLEFTVCARDGFALLTAVVAVSRSGASAGRGFLAWATARGPAQAGNIGHATLAKTKLARSVTGRTFSFIFSWRPESEIPKTICWTLLYTRRQILKALD